MADLLVETRACEFNKGDIVSMRSDMGGEVRIKFGILSQSFRNQGGQERARIYWLPKSIWSEEITIYRRRILVERLVEPVLLTNWHYNRICREKIGTLFATCQDYIIVNGQGRAFLWDKSRKKEFYFEELL